MNPASKYTIGIRFGILTGLIYVVFLFLRYSYFASNPLSFGLFAIVSYVLILLVYLFTGIARKKELGGYGDFKEIFQSIFIAILIAEAVYVMFNLIYIKYVDPAFWENFKATTLSYLEKKGLTDDQIDQQMKGFKDMDQQMKPVGLLKGYGFSIVMDSVFGLVFAAILRKKKPVFEETPEAPKL
jgi:hypothetical protein